MESGKDRWNGWMTGLQKKTTLFFNPVLVCIHIYVGKKNYRGSWSSSVRERERERRSNLCVVLFLYKTRQQLTDWLPVSTSKERRDKSSRSNTQNGTRRPANIHIIAISGTNRVFKIIETSQLLAPSPEH